MAMDRAQMGFCDVHRFILSVDHQTLFSALKKMNIVFTLFSFLFNAHKKSILKPQLDVKVLFTY